MEMPPPQTEKSGLSWDAYSMSVASSHNSRPTVSRYSNSLKRTPLSSGSKRPLWMMEGSVLFFKRMGIRQLSNLLRRILTFVNLVAESDRARRGSIKKSLQTTKNNNSEEPMLTRKSLKALLSPRVQPLDNKRLLLRPCPLQMISMLRSLRPLEGWIHLLRKVFRNPL